MRSVEGGNTIYGWTMILSYAVHVLAGAAWLGGLPALLLALFETRLAGASANANSLDILGRFSLMASFAVGAIVVSGVANTIFRVGTNLGALAAATYGTVLAIKLGVVAIMLGLATYNRFIAMPRLRPFGSDRATGRLRLGVGVELALGIVVLAAVAVLGITAPPQ